ncbi:accessory gene regulator ArgB-like protein [Desulforamulus ruminis]|uniref:Accessory gene regulator B n=1 Tax=Desulforamulus ruminis (strain ATCC 23193 / DSM 2154 / NCIMB 8452 / DL) TaxID=696281 RepID=F6DSJ3_DESRL|nr:accessory gene regulator B family protein [Desulforamulus ruminis]AEG61083.1 Accessory gene regulator B [Desulforamulus ruminis DSM 2154]
MIHGWSVHLAQYLGTELNLDHRKVAVVAYGLEVIIGALIKLAVFVLVPSILGVFKLFAFALISSAILRLPSGGVHNNAYYKCLLSTLTFFLIIAFTAKGLAVYPLPLNVFAFLILLLAFLVFIKLAPVDNQEKPIKSEARRKRLKFISCSLLVGYGVIFFLWSPEQDIMLAFLLAVLFHTFTLTKMGHALFKAIDNLI